MCKERYHTDEKRLLYLVVQDTFIFKNTKLDYDLLGRYECCLI